MDNKKNSRILKAVEFAAVLFLFAVPPLLAQPETVTAPFGPVQSAIYALVCAGLLLLSGRSPVSAGFFSGRTLAFSAAAFLLVAGTACAASFLAGAPQQTVLPPSGTGAWFLFAAGVLVSASFEEILFRWYMPETLSVIFYSLKDKNGVDIKKRKWKNLLFFLTAEAFPAVFFALAHLYAGPFAVANALAAAAVLRCLVKKTGSPFTACAVHFCYNMTAYAALFSAAR